MKVSEKKEFVGEFYLPQDPRYKIPGVLKIGLNGDVRLEIFGNFRRHPLLENEWNVPLINGDVADVGRVTILDCRYISLRLGGTPMKTPIVARCALCNIDAAYKNKEEIEFNAIRFSVERLNWWLDFVSGNLVGDDPAKGIAMNYIRPENIEAKLKGGIKIRFVFDINGRWSIEDGDKITQSTHITVTSEQPRSLSYFMDLTAKINTFLCMALGQIVCIKDVKASGRKIGGKRPPDTEIYYRPFICTEESPKWNSSFALFRLHDIEQNLSARFDRWIKKYKLVQPTYSLYLSCRMGEVKSLGIAFLSLVQALENLHEAGRKLYGWPRNNGLEGKLRELIFTFENLIPRDQVAMWNEIIKDVVGVRNYLTHYSKTTPDFKEKSENPVIVDFLCLKLAVIIQLHFLKQIRFENQEIAELLERAHGLESALRRPYQLKCKGK